MKKAAAAAARAFTFSRLPRLHGWCKGCFGAFAAVLFALISPPPALADGVDDKTYLRIEDCIRNRPGDVAACLAPVFQACSESQTAMACDYNISGEALDIVAGIHATIGDEIRRFAIFSGQLCALAMDSNSPGYERNTEHALCVRERRTRLIELLITR